jgi:hypothetical protein
MGLIARKCVDIRHFDLNLTIFSILNRYSKTFSCGSLCSKKLCRLGKFIHLRDKIRIA